MSDRVLLAGDIVVSSGGRANWTEDLCIYLLVKIKMITAFELKNRPCCRFFYKIPYFIKNFILLGILCVVLLFNYLVHYEKSDLSWQNVSKMLTVGLNHQMFNYLQNMDTMHALSITQNLKKVNAHTTSQVDFYSSCVSKNRPCLLEGMSSTWPAFERWQYKNGGQKTLTDDIGDRLVDVFFTENKRGIDLDDNEHMDMGFGHSFHPESVQKLAYASEFVPRLTKSEVGGITMRDLQMKDVIGKHI